MRLRRMGNEELRAAGVRPGEGHPHRGARVFLQIDLVADRVARPALRVVPRIASLDHEVRHHAHERRVVEEVSGGELREVPRGHRCILRQQSHLDAPPGHVNARRVRLPGPLNDLRIIRPFDRQWRVLRPRLSELLFDQIGRHSAHDRIVVAQKAAQKCLAARIVDFRQSADSREARIVLFVAPRSLFRRGQHLQLLRVLRLRITVDGVAADDRVRILERRSDELERDIDAIVGDRAHCVGSHHRIWVARVNGTKAIRER